MSSKKYVRKYYLRNLRTFGLRGTDTNNPISCLDIRRFDGLWSEHILQAECHDTTWRWCSSLKRSCSETSGGDQIGYRVLGDHKRKRKKKKEERQNEKRRPALMQRRGSAGYYEFFRNLKDSSKAWLSVHTRVCECVCWGAGVHVRATLWSVSRLREGPSVGMIYY